MNNKKLYVFLHPHRSAGITIINHIVKNSSPEEYFLIDQFTGKPGFEKKLKEETKNKKLKYILGHETFYGLKDIFKNREVKFFTMVRDPAEKIVSMYNIYLSLPSDKKKVPFERWYSTLKRNPQLSFHYERLKISSYESQRLKRRKMFFYRSAKKFDKTGDAILFGLRKFRNSFFPRENPGKMFSEVKNLFSRLFFIGFVEDSKKDLKKLFDILGVPGGWENKNSSRKKSNVPPFILTESLRKKIYRENPYDVKLYNYAIDLMKKDITKIK